MSSSSSSHDSSSSDEEMLFDEMDQEVVMFFQCVFNALNSEDLLNDHEDEGIREFVDWVAGSEMFWPQCNTHPPYSKTPLTSH
jgi:hypothetical protein